MIYEYPTEDEPIKQGDIFYPLPWILIDLNRIYITTEEWQKKSNWLSIQDEDKIVINAPIKPTWGIVANQNCDILRAPLISLFKIASFKKVTGLDLPASPKKWVSLITQRSRLNAKWFYLAKEERLGFKEKMAVNFQEVFQIPCDNLTEYIELRKGRLNRIAYEHYRESIANYFRRYPYDEWYPLDKTEFKEYNKGYNGTVKPFDWQK